MRYICVNEYKKNDISYIKENDIVVIQNSSTGYNITRGLDFPIENKNEELFIAKYLSPIMSDLNTDEEDSKEEISDALEYMMGFPAVLQEMNNLYIRKNSDYGNSFDESLDKFGLIASIVRLNDKFNRIESLIKNKQQLVKNESIRDTFIDLANYAAMTVAWLDKQN